MRKVVLHANAELNAPRYFGADSMTPALMITAPLDVAPAARPVLTLRGRDTGADLLAFDVLGVIFANLILDGRHATNCTTALRLGGRFSSVVNVTVQNWRCSDAIVGFQASGPAMDYRVDGLVFTSALENVVFSNVSAPTTVIASGQPSLKIRQVQSHLGSGVAAGTLGGAGCTFLHASDLVRGEVEGISLRGYNSTGGRPLLGSLSTANPSHSGAGISVRDVVSVVVRDCVFQDLASVGSGSAIWVGPMLISGLVDISNVTIRNTAAAGAVGGAINIEATLKLTVRMQYAEFANVSAAGSSACGGALRVAGAKAVSLSNIAVTNARSEGSGGALCIASATSLYLASILVQQSSARGPGGAISLGAVERVDISDSNVTASTALGTAGNGGAVALLCDHVTVCFLTIRRSSFRQNAAAGFGGAVYAASVWENSQLVAELTDIELTSNRADLHKGALYYDAGTFVGVSSLNVIRALVQKNRAGSHGGGLYVHSRVLQLRSFDMPGQAYFTLWLVDSILLSNSAGGSGGGVRSEVATLMLNRTVFRGNTAGLEGGGLGTVGCSVHISSVHWEGNSATTGGGVALTRCLSSGVTTDWNSDASPVALPGVLTSGRLAVQISPLSASFLLYNNTASGSAGGMLLSACSASLDFVVAVRNSAGDSGGALSVDSTTASLDISIGPLVAAANRAWGSGVLAGGGAVHLHVGQSGISVGPWPPAAASSANNYSLWLNASVATAEQLFAFEGPSIYAASARQKLKKLLALTSSTVTVASAAQASWFNASAPLPALPFLYTLFMVANRAELGSGGGLLFISNTQIASTPVKVTAQRLYSLAAAAQLRGGNVAVAGLANLTLSNACINASQASNSSSAVVGRRGGLALSAFSVTVSAVTFQDSAAHVGAALWLQQAGSVPLGAASSARLISLASSNCVAWHGGARAFFDVGAPVACQNCSSIQPGRGVWYGNEDASGPRTAALPTSTYFATVNGAEVLVVVSSTPVTAPVLELALLDALSATVLSDNTTFCTVEGVRNDTGGTLPLLVNAKYTAVKGRLIVQPFQVLAGPNIAGFLRIRCATIDNQLPEVTIPLLTSRVRVVWSPVTVAGPISALPSAGNRIYPPTRSIAVQLVDWSGRDIPVEGVRCTLTAVAAATSAGAATSASLLGDPSATTQLGLAAFAIGLQSGANITVTLNASCAWLTGDVVMSEISLKVYTAALRTLLAGSAASGQPTCNCSAIAGASSGCLSACQALVLAGTTATLVEGSGGSLWAVDREAGGSLRRLYTSLLPADEGADAVLPAALPSGPDASTLQPLSPPPMLVVVAEFRTGQGGWTRSLVSDLSLSCTVSAVAAAAVTGTTVTVTYYGLGEFEAVGVRGAEFGANIPITASCSWISGEVVSAGALWVRMRSLRASLTTLAPALTLPSRVLVPAPVLTLQISQGSAGQQYGPFMQSALPCTANVIPADGTNATGLLRLLGTTMVQTSLMDGTAAFSSLAVVAAPGTSVQLVFTCTWWSGATVNTTSPLLELPSFRARFVSGVVTLEGIPEAGTVQAVAELPPAYVLYNTPLPPICVQAELMQLQL